MKLILTTYALALLEDPGYLRIHLNHLSSLECHFLVASSHLLLNPRLKRLSNNSVYQVGQIGSGQPFDLSSDARQCFEYSFIAFDIFQHGLDGEAFEVGHLQHLNLFAFDSCPQTHSKVSEMEDGNRFYGW